MAIKTNKTEEAQNSATPKINEVGKATPEQLDAWKKEYESQGEIKVITLKVSETETAFGYLKPPARLTIAKAMSMFAEKQLIECGTFILNNCWIGGDERMRTDDRMNIAASTYANGCIEFMEGDLKNA
jgi:hypothetical protein